MNNFETAFGMLGKYIDNFLIWQFSHWYIAVPMCGIELFIALLLILYRIGDCE